MASVEVEGLQATEKINVHYATCMDDLIDFFDDLATHWQGWTGTKSYESLERNLRLTARVDGTGHVLMAIELKSHHIDHQWSVSTQIRTEPGAQMTEAAEKAHVLLSKFP
jgi:hypothetical protein